MPPGCSSRSSYPIPDCLGYPGYSSYQNDNDADGGNGNAGLARHYCRNAESAYAHAHTAANLYPSAHLDSRTYLDSGTHQHADSYDDGGPNAHQNADQYSGAQHRRLE